MTHVFKGHFQRRRDVWAVILFVVLPGLIVGIAGAYLIWTVLRLHR